MANHNDAHAPDVKLYMKVFATLLFLTVVTVAISKVHLPRPQAIGLGLAVACVKAGLVVAFFMHLKGEHKLIYRALYVTFGLALGLLVAIVDHTLLAHVMTGRVSVAQQRPAHEGGHVEPGHEDARPGEALKENSKPARLNKSKAEQKRGASEKAR